MKFLELIHSYYKECSIRYSGVICIVIISFSAKAQPEDSLPFHLSLENCIVYAVNHQPYVQQARIDEAITERTIKSKLSAWYPQINLNYNIQHYLQLPSVTNPLALKNSSYASVSATQNIFNRDVLLASKTAGDARLNARENTQLSKIDLVVGVSKSFYNVLVTTKQIEMLNSDILQLQKSLKDAQAQYQAGTVDKTDYQRATISLNNAFASRKQYEEQLKSSLGILKQQMGYNVREELVLDHNDQQLQDEIVLDTTGTPSYTDRVEYQQLETQQRLLRNSLKYAKWSYLPAVSLFGNYNIVGQNNALSKVYAAEYPNSLFGLTLSVPLFQGSARIQGVRQAELQLRRLDWDFQNLKAAIDTGYISAIAMYKTSLNDYIVSKDNLSLTKEVYNTIQLQYKTGISSYLNVIIAYTDLRTAEVNSLNALYQVLSSKLDVQKAAGTINY